MAGSKLHGLSDMTDRLRMMVVFGTRPEAIKLAPVIGELRKHQQIQTRVVVTGQHREMLHQTLADLNVEADSNLDVMLPNQSLSVLTSRVLEGVSQQLVEHPAEIVIVQGDTTTTMAASLAGIYHRAAVAHVEAGLRTHDRNYPFPEEVNRVLTTHLATWHFAPTDSARQNLLREGIRPEAIHVTGNTVIDALLQTVAGESTHADGRREILVTAHRRESFGKPLEQICDALLDIVRIHPSVKVLFPVHLNPHVQSTVREKLGKCPAIQLTQPLGYREFARMLARCTLVLTDSGGIQEEAPSLGKPVLVLRNETERSEGVEAGTCKLVGQDRERIVAEVSRLLTDRAAYDAMSRAVNPYGDGNASQRIVQHLLAGRA